MRTIIIDDESRARQSIINLIKLSGIQINIVAEAESVDSGFNMITKYEPDLILLDINLQDGTGFDLLKKLPSIPFKIIFITAYEEFAIKAFEFSAIDYLLKPLDPLKLQNALKKANDTFSKENMIIKLNALFTNLNLKDGNTQKLVLHTDKKIHIVETKDIIRCESNAGYTTFYLVDGKKVMVSRTLKSYETLLLDYHFFRAHQSHLINLDYIDHFRKKDGGSVVMKNQHKVPIAQRKREAFLSILASL